MGYERHWHNFIIQCGNCFSIIKSLFKLPIDSDESEGGPATSSRHLATTDDFHDDGKVDKLDADIALNLTLDEVNKKVRNKPFVTLKGRKMRHIYK